MRKMYAILIILLCFILSGCNEKIEEKDQYYIKILYMEENDNALNKLERIIDGKNDLEKRYGTEVEILEIKKNANIKDNLLTNKVIDIKPNKNITAVYMKNDKTKLLAVMYDDYSTIDDLYEKAVENVEKQSAVYQLPGYKFLFINNSGDIDYGKYTKVSSVENFKEVVYSKLKNSNNVNLVANNYLVKESDDDFIILDGNNNMLLHYNIENMNYFTNKSDGNINLDASIMAHILKIKPEKATKKILYFYNPSDPNYKRQVKEVEKFNLVSPDKYQIIQIPLSSSDLRDDAIKIYIKKLFSLNENISTMVIIDDFKNFNNINSIAEFKTSEDLLNYFRMKKVQ